MGTSQSKEKCGCFGSTKGGQSKEYRVRSCVTEVSMESMEREINRVRARQRIAEQKGYLKYKGPKIQKTSNIQSQHGCQHYINQNDHPLALSSRTGSLDSVDTVCVIFSRLIGAPAAEAKAVDIAVQKKATAVKEICILEETVAKAVDFAEQEKAVEFTAILDEVVTKAVDIAEQQKAAAVVDILDEIVFKAVDISEQEKKAVAADILDEAVAKAIVTVEQQKTTAVTDILDETMAKAVDIAEQKKAVALADIFLDEAVAQAVDIAEQKKAKVVAEILDETVATTVDIAEQQKAVAFAEILDEAVAKAVDIAEQKKTKVVTEILDETLVKAVNIAEQKKAVVFAEILDEAVAKAVDTAEQQKAVVFAEILDEAVAKAVDIAEQKKAKVVAEILDETVATAVDIAEQQKTAAVAEITNGLAEYEAAVIADILDEAVVTVVDIAEQQKTVTVAEIVDEAVAMAFDIAEQKAVVVAEIADEAVADNCIPLNSVNVPCSIVVTHDETLKSVEHEDDVSVKVEPLMVPSMSRNGSWVRDSSRKSIAATKQSEVIMAETKASLYKPCQLKEAFNQTKTLEEKAFGLHQVSMSPFRDPLRTELYSGKFTILGSRDHSGCAVAVFMAQGHSPATAHEVVMNNIYFQMNQAVKSPQTQSNGIILLYDFSKADYKASDLRLFAKILQLFKTAYPVSLKRTLLISAPFWLEAELRLLGLRVRRQDRIEIVTRDKLKECVPVTCLPEELGGNEHHDHVRWIEQCLAGYVETFGSDKRQNEWTNEPARNEDVESEVKSDVQKNQDRPCVSTAIIWQPKEFGHGSGLKRVAERKVQGNRERHTTPPNLIWQTSPEKPGQASLRAVPSELKGESKRKVEGTKGSSSPGNLIWQLNPKKP